MTHSTETMADEKLTYDELWYCLQLSDSAFGGSLSHSMGLESALHFGYVEKTMESFRKFIFSIIEQVSMKVVNTTFFV